MDNFDTRDLLMSLCCPCLSLLWGLINLINCISWGADFTITGGLFRISFFIAILLGGIFPIVLTLKFKIHTEDYLKKRLIIILAIYFIHAVIGKIGYPIIMFVLYMLVGIIAIFLQVFKVQEEYSTNGERVVLIFSDPIIYWTIYWFLFYLIRGFRL